MRLLLAGLAIAAAAVVALPALGATKSITVGDNFFRPASVSVSKGTTVKWVWHGAVAHNVVVKSGPQKFRSPIAGGNGFTFKHKMTRAGTYKIFCEVHGYAAMHMTLKVR
ncbi:MAG TPA: plastocyanin/azurin family copper-binding protein [Gaiellales bacterium]|nr:plastocyanin/azurin family copper-binding protein [Gaiellales bacterium]